MLKQDSQATSQWIKCLPSRIFFVLSFSKVLYAGCPYFIESVWIRWIEMGMNQFIWCLNPLLTLLQGMGIFKWKWENIEECMTANLPNGCCSLVFLIPSWSPEQSTLDTREHALCQPWSGTNKLFHVETHADLIVWENMAPMKKSQTQWNYSTAPQMWHLWNCSSCGGLLEDRRRPNTWRNVVWPQGEDKWCQPRFALSSLPNASSYRSYFRTNIVSWCACHE